MLDEQVAVMLLEYHPKELTIILVLLIKKYMTQVLANILEVIQVSLL